MLKPLFILLLTLNFSLLAHSQTWESVGGGVSGGDSIHPAVRAMTVYDNKLYVGGSFKYAGNLIAYNIASWNGRTWDTLTNGVRCRYNDKLFCPYGAHIDALIAYDNALYVGGVFDLAGRKISPTQDIHDKGFDYNTVNIAEWIDTIHTIPAWYSLPNGIGWTSISLDMNSTLINDLCVRALCTYDDDLFIGGVFLNPGGLGNHIHDLAKWNYKTEWAGFSYTKTYHKTSQSPAFLNSDLSYVTSMITYQGKLIIGCELKNELFEEKDSNKVICTYNDTIFTGIATGVANKNFVIPRCMAVYNDELYVGGYYYSSPARTYGVIKWDGKVWRPVGKDDWDKKGTVWSMAEYQGKLYIGGRFDSISGQPANNIAVWDGKTLKPCGAGFKGKGKRRGVVRTLCVYNNELYAGGDLYTSGGKPMLNIAKLKLDK